MIEMMDFLEKYGIEKESVIEMTKNISIERFLEIHKEFGKGKETRKFLEEEIVYQLSYFLVEAPVPFLKNFPSFNEDEEMPHWFVNVIRIENTGEKLFWKKSPRILVTMLIRNSFRIEDEYQKLLEFFPAYKIKSIFNGDDENAMIDEVSNYLEKITERANQTNELELFRDELIESLEAYCARGHIK